MWYQAEVRLKAMRRGVHLITREVLEAVPQIAELNVGLLHVFIQHTSASLTINENADPDVRVDLEMAMNHVVSEQLNYIHTLEGPDDMPAHIKASMMGSSVTIPIRHGRPALGTWQGIYLCEHRNQGGSRSLVITLQGKRDKTVGSEPRWNVATAPLAVANATQTAGSRSKRSLRPDPTTGRSSIAAGRQQAGRQSMGRQSMGRQSMGRQSMGRQSMGRQSMGRQRAGMCQGRRGCRRHGNCQYTAGGSLGNQRLREPGWESLSSI